MTRVLVSLEDIILTFGGKPLFEKLRLHIGENDRICLIGKNGAGKTTLMRLIMGELELDGGTRYICPGIKLGYLAQQVQHDPNISVTEFVLSGLPAEKRNEESKHLAEMVIAPLSLPEHAQMKTLSGGQLRRAALARALVEEPEVLLLDEPTNHLDLAAIEWLERRLINYRGSILVISHDRAFLSAISKKVFWLDRGIIRTCPTGYQGFDEWMEQLVTQEARELRNLQKKLNAEDDWMHGGVTARRKRNQRRLTDLHRLREKLQNDKNALKQRLAKIELDPLTPAQASKKVVEFKQVNKSFTHGDVEIPILKNFNLRIFRGDRVGILGKNGSGKSTFLKMLVGDLEPDSGRVTHGKTIEISYFDQNRSLLDPSKTLWETLCPEGGDHVFIGRGENERSQHVCGYLKNFLFDPKIARDRVGTLSGGQQNRLMLAKILLNPGNVLILDEPTNDLDMDTLDMLQEILADYTGTLLIVSHDRDFLDRTVSEVLAFEGQGVVEAYIGGYSDYIRTKRISVINNAPAREEKLSSDSEKRTTAPVKISFKFKHEFAQLPKKIEALEKEIAALQTTLSDSNLYMENPREFDRASTRLPRAQVELETAEHRWLELDELFNSDQK